jgi:chorismate synthase
MVVSKKSINLCYTSRDMATLRYMTAGESHGKGLIGIIEGIPSGLSLSAADIDTDLGRRQGGYGRGGRMKIESDHAEILSGVRWGKTIGSPVALLIENKDFANWVEGMSAASGYSGSIPPVTRPRPGHADFAGAVKYGHGDVRNVLERSSARETAMRVALGAVARKFLSHFDISVGSFVIRIGSRKFETESHLLNAKKLMDMCKKADKSPVRCPDKETSAKMVGLVDKAAREGDSLGGVFEVIVTGLPVGLGSFVQWDRRLEGRLAKALMSIQAIKGVESGGGFEMSGAFGSRVMDEIFYAPPRKIAESGKGTGRVGTGFFRKTNFSGGIEGGMTIGMPLILRAAMKPIPTLRRPLRSVDITTRKPVKAAYERSDTCAVPAAAVIGEAMAALTIADAFLEKFGGDSMDEVARNFNSYIGYVRNF